jgi:hypothetical protein
MSAAAESMARLAGEVEGPDWHITAEQRRELKVMFSVVGRKMTEIAANPNSAYSQSWLGYVTEMAELIDYIDDTGHDVVRHDASFYDWMHDFLHRGYDRILFAESSNRDRDAPPIESEADLANFRVYTRDQFKSVLGK